MHLHGADDNTSTRDEVIVFEPAYDSYIPNVVVNGAIPVRIDLRFPDYRIDWERSDVRSAPERG